MIRAGRTPRSPLHVPRHRREAERIFEALTRRSPLITYKRRRLPLGGSWRHEHPNDGAGLAKLEVFGNGAAHANSNR
jgi:hypothetical protein